jgi:tetratricopeptide (TPR) repeat protein
VFRLLGDAYLRLPDAQYGAADGAYKQALDRVRVRMRGKRVPQASVKPSELSRVSPRDRREMGELHANRGLARLGQSETDKAIGSYRASALWHPGDYEVQHTLGALLMRAGGLSDALPHLEIAAQLAPPADADRVQRDLVAAGRLIRERSQTLYEEAGDAYERGDRERALARYQDAIEVRKNFAEAWLRAGMLLARYRGNLRDAATYVQQAVAILDEERARSTRPEAADAARLRAEAEAGLREIEGMRDAPDEPGPPKEPVVPK